MFYNPIDMVQGVYREHISFRSSPEQITLMLSPQVFCRLPSAIKDKMKAMKLNS